MINYLPDPYRGLPSQRNRKKTATVNPKIFEECLGQEDSKFEEYLELVIGENHRNVLRLHFLYKMTWSDIAKKLNVTLTVLWDMKDNALRQIEKKI